MQRDFSKLAGQHFDVLVCGGGIYGAWSAYDAALRRLKVAIVDQGDWAHATSSSSSKLIHGGLRYLELFDFVLVRKTLKERQMLLKVAPHRIWPLRFGIPVYKNSRLGALRLQLGLFIYDLLAGILTTPQAHQHSSITDFIRRFPDIRSDSLVGGFSYLDAQTDDARLVLELIDGALSAGAVCLNYCKVTGLIEDDGHIIGAHVMDLTCSKAAVVHTRHIINTSGPWLASIEECRVTKGVHLILPNILKNEALLLTAKTDGRVFFVLPWYGLTLLGTTDTDYVGNIENADVNQQDIDYLLTEVNRAFKSVKWTEKDIIGRFVGLRVLNQDTNTAPSNVSRDWRLSISNTGLFTSIGGKLTSARADAACIIDNLCEHLSVHESCKTNLKPFPWSPTTTYSEWANCNHNKALELGIDEECSHWLLRRYGKHVDLLFELTLNNPDLAKRIIPTVPFIMAELEFCSRNEMVVHLDDLLRRRIPIMILTTYDHHELLHITELAALILGWDHATMTDEINRCISKWHLCS